MGRVMVDLFYTHASKQFELDTQYNGCHFLHDLWTQLEFNTKLDDYDWKVWPGEKIYMYILISMS
jgi:hypothetical protein